MKRYLKVNGQWIDTLEALKNNICYIVINGIVYDAYTDVEIGTLEDETNVL